MTLSTRGWELWHTNANAPVAGLRTFKQHVNHSKRMSQIPQVFIGLNAIDLLLPGPLCVRVNPTNVTNTGMDIEFSTFNGTRVWSAGVTWFAFVPHEGGPSFRTGSVQCDPSVAGYTLHQPGEPGCPHIFEYYVPFPQPFSRDMPPPVVLTAISGFNAPARGPQGPTPLRLRVSAAEIDVDHFKLQVMTWEDSLVTDVTVSWLAFSVSVGSPFAGCITSGVQPCMNTAPNFAVASGKGPRDFVQKIPFPGFHDVPAVATWLSGMEVFTRTDVRLKAVEKARTRNGCDLVFGTWDNTLVGGGDITWFAFVDTPPNGGAAPEGMRDASGRRFNLAPPAGPGPAPGPAPGPMQPMPPPPMGVMPPDMGMPPPGPMMPPPGPMMPPPDMGGMPPPMGGMPPPMGGMPPPMGGMPGGDQNGVEAGMECIVCFERAKDTLLQPCNHICCCSQCAAKLSPNICPVCRSAIDSKVKIFFT